MENKENQELAVAGCLSIILYVVLSIAMAIYAGAAIKFVWNTLIVNTFDVPKLLLWQAIGIDMLITYITGYANNLKDEHKGELGTIMTVALVKGGVLFLGTYILSLFM